MDAAEDEEERELINFYPVTAVAPDGEIRVNAGKFARAQILMAFEMMGGVASFTEWAMNNKGDFYTKMFTKVIGREVEEQKGADPVEAYLAVLDLEAEEITPEGASPEMAQFTTENLTEAKLAHAAKVWADRETLG